jgi:hypothetical protein
LIGDFDAVRRSCASSGTRTVSFICGIRCWFARLVALLGVVFSFISADVICAPLLLTVRLTALLLCCFDSNLLEASLCSIVSSPLIVLTACFLYVTLYLIRLSGLFLVNI